MNYEKIEIDGIAIFRLDEKRLDANISGLVKGELTLMVKSEQVDRLVIDLRNVENCDSSGLSSLLVANRLVSSVEGGMRIVINSEKILNLIKITQLDKVLDICSTLEEALIDLSDDTE